MTPAEYRRRLRGAVAENDATAAERLTRAFAWAHLWRTLCRLVVSLRGRVGAKPARRPVRRPPLGR